MTGTASLSSGNGRGTLEETQVRAMFDRIAGLYDRYFRATVHDRW